MRAGSLNRRVMIQKRDTGRDAAGQPLQTWSDYAQAWADVKSPTGLGAIRDMQGDLSASVARYSIRLRYRTDLNFAMRVKYGDQVFDVKQVQQDFTGHRYTDLVCELGNL